MDDDVIEGVARSAALPPDKLAIIAAPLPAALDFTALKELGVAHLKALSGKIWTNYNATDPGVTILDQLCYALTELGYCAQFPVADVLTQQDGKIHYRDQFFDPQNILTCSPVTIADYRRLVLDRVDAVRAIYLVREMAQESVQNPAPAVTGRYRVWVAAPDTAPAPDPQQLQQLCARVDAVLNAHRNLGEFFLYPEVLAVQPVVLAGAVTLLPQADAAVVEDRIVQALRDYEAPLAQQSGYAQLRAEGWRADQIFNGPRMQNGWITGDAALGNKRDCVSVLELRSLLAAVDGVASVQALRFDAEPQATTIGIGPAALARITLGAGFSFTQQGATVARRPLAAAGARAAAGTGAGRAQPGQGYLARLRATHQAAGVASKVDLAPPLPQGRYRNIEQYYSIQNTFPDIYGIGHNALPADASSARIAGVRQLKGYLMIFDQLLANEFSQLANLAGLFSFRPPHTRPQPWQRQMPQSGIATVPFATTYYYQPLYDVPNVQSLLRGHDAFQYQFDPALPAALAGAQAWQKFMQFPNNHYIRGLRACMETDTEAAARRDRILSHLMARQGDDARPYDTMIDACQWYGGKLQTRIVVKTMWLQNYQALSYSRSKGCNQLTRRPLVRLLPAETVTNAVFLSLLVRPGKQEQARSNQGMPWWSYPAYPDRNGAIDQALIYANAKSRRVDLNNFSTFEVVCDILLNLSAHLQALSSRLYALLDDAGFLAWLAQPDRSDTVFSLPNSDVSVRAGSACDQVFDGAQCLLDVAWLAAAAGPVAPAPSDYRAHANQLLWLALQRKGFLLVEHILLSPPLRAGDGKGEGEAVAQPLGAALIFPGYVTLIGQPAFRQYVATLLNLHWPAHIAAHYRTVPFVAMQQLVTLYCAWYNHPGDAGAGVRLAKLLEAPSAPEEGHAR